MLKNIFVESLQSFTVLVRIFTKEQMLTVGAEAVFANLRVEGYRVSKLVDMTCR